MPVQYRQGSTADLDLGRAPLPMGCAASVRRVSAEEFSDPMTVVQPSAALATSASSASSLSDLPSEFPLMSSLSDSLDAQPKGVESRRVAFSVTSVQVGEDTFQEVDFEDEQLTSFRSWDQKHDETFDGPLGVPLPPGRLEHQANTRRVKRFMVGAQRFPQKFQEIVGRSDEE